MEEAAEQGEVQQDEGSVVLGIAKAAALLGRGLGFLVRDVPVLEAGLHCDPGVIRVVSLPALPGLLPEEGVVSGLVRTC